VADELEVLGDAQHADKLGQDALRLSNHLWRPWYAKLWWAAIPLYWLAMGEPTRPAFLDGFADSGFALVTNMLFVPIIPIVVFGMRFVRHAATVGRVEPLSRNAHRIFGRPSDEDSWCSLQNPSRFRNVEIRKIHKF